MSTDIKLAGNDLEFLFCELKARWNKKKIIKYLQSQHPDDKDVKAICGYLLHNPMNVFPYTYQKKYDLNQVVAEKDSKTKLIRVLHKDKWIYMRRKYKSLFRARRYYNNLCIEQDCESPHRYTTDSFYPDSESVIIDIGGAEGFFSIDYVEKCKKIYIFECDDEWIEALMHTYSNYMDKIVIINKYVCNYSDKNHISIDDFVKENNLKKEKLFIKIDAEGTEPLIYEGMKNCISDNQKMKIAMCVYHSQNHEQFFEEQFNGWKIEHSDGYMMYYYDMNYSEPYLRRGVLKISNCS